MTADLFQVPATVIGGALKPDADVRLPENTRVLLTVEPVANPTSSKQAFEAFKALIANHPIHGGGMRLTRDEMHERR